MMSVFEHYAADLIRNGFATRLGGTVSAALGQRVNELPWTGTHVAWHKTPGTVRFDWGQQSDTATADFVRTLSIGHFNQLCAFYGTSYPVFSFEADWLFDNLDLAAVGTHQYFLFGHINGDIDLSTFAEFETASTVWGWRA